MRSTFLAALVAGLAALAPSATAAPTSAELDGTYTTDFRGSVTHGQAHIETSADDVTITNERGQVGHGTYDPTAGTLRVTSGWPDTTPSHPVTAQVSGSGGTATITYAPLLDGGPGGTWTKEPTPATVAPKPDVPTLYTPPAPGRTATYPLPKVGKETKSVSGDIRFVDNNGNPVAGPDLVAIGAQGAKAVKLCALVLWAEQPHEDLGAYAKVPTIFAKCVDVVARVLARADQIKRQKSQARAAASGCLQRVFALRHARRAPVRVSCTRTATGAHVTIRPRHQGQTLRKALHGGAPKLTVGRSAVTPGPAGASLQVLWHTR